MSKKSHTHTDLLWNWFKRLRFSTTYVWMNSLLFFCIWKTDKSFFFRHIWWRLWKYHWVLSVASFPVSSQYSSLSSIIYVLDIFRNVAFVFILTSKYWCYVFIWCQIFCHFSYFFSSEFRRPKIILSIWHVRIFLNKVYLLDHLLFAELNGHMVRERLFPPIFKSISFKLLWHTFTYSQTNHWSGKFLLRWWSVMRIPIWFLLSILIIFDWENFRNYFSLENISKKMSIDR